MQALKSPLYSVLWISILWSMPIIYQIIVDSKNLSTTTSLLPALIGAMIYALYGIATQKTNHALSKAKATTICAISVALILDFITDKSGNAYIYIGDLAEWAFNHAPSNISSALTNPDLYQNMLPVIVIAKLTYLVYLSIKSIMEVAR